MPRLSLVLVLALATAACSSRPPSAPPVPATGIVTLPTLLDRASLQDVDLGDDPLDPQLRFSLWSGELVVVGVDRPADKRFVVTTRRGGPHLPLAASTAWRPVDVGGREGSIGPWGDQPGCGRRTLTLQATPETRLVVSGVTDQPDDALMRLAEALTVTGLRVGTDALGASAGRVGRLPDGWLGGGGGSRLTVERHDYLVRRVDPAEQRLLLALRCPDPQRQLTPPASTGPEELAGYGSARRRIDGRTVDSGVSGGAQLAVVGGRPGLAVFTGLGCCSLPPARQLVELAAGADVVPESRLRALDDEVRGRVEAISRQRLDHDIAGEGATVVARGHDGDLSWVLARRQHRLFEGQVDAELCWTPVSSLDGQPGYRYMGECLVERATAETLVVGPMSAGPQLDHVWGAVGPDVATVEVSGPGLVTRRHAALATSSGPVRRVFVAAVNPVEVTDGFSRGDLLRRTFVLAGGPVVVRALAADGRELAAVAVGKAGCPLPPGCTP
ncbi:MAG: hypothetical protein JWN29_2609 [Acidimicrobiales bacterium]|nr:hypothetical protein [Acidimicrobiales bacterium]